MTSGMKNHDLTTGFVELTQIWRRSYLYQREPELFLLTSKHWEILSQLSVSVYWTEHQYAVLLYHCFVQHCQETIFGRMSRTKFLLGKLYVEYCLDQWQRYSRTAPTIARILSGIIVRYRIISWIHFTYFIASTHRYRKN